MKNKQYSSSPVKHCQFAIYPNSNIFEPLELQKKKIFDRIIITLRNKHIDYFSQKNYKYHTLISDSKKIFDKNDVLNRKFIIILEEIEKYILNKIEYPIKNKTVIKIINTESNHKIDKIDLYNIIQVTKPLHEIKIIKTKKKSVKSKLKSPLKNTVPSVKASSLNTKNCVFIDRNKDESNINFMNKMREKYVMLERNEIIKINERIEKYKMNNKKNISLDIKNDQLLLESINSKNFTNSTDLILESSKKASRNKSNRKVNSELSVKNIL